MADAPADNKVSQTAPSGTSPAAAKQIKPKADSKPKATQSKKTDTKPNEAEAVAQSVALNGVTVGVNGAPTLLDPRQARDELAKALGDLEQTIARAEAGLSAHYDLTGLRRHLEGARKWFGKELGLDTDSDGNFSRADGGSQLPVPAENASQTGDESPAGRKQLKEATENRKKAEKAE